MAGVRRGACLLAAAGLLGGSAQARDGDPVAGRRLVLDRQLGSCTLCHPLAGIPRERLGDLAPPLDGVGSRLDRQSLRDRVADMRRFNPDTIMPPYFSAEGLNRVPLAQRGRTLLTAAQLDDVVAFLAQLKEAPR